MHPIMLARGTSMVNMFRRICEKEMQFRGYRDSD
jgi:hypothetical protein